MSQDQEPRPFFTSDAPSWVYWGLTAAMLGAVGLVWHSYRGALRDLGNAAEARTEQNRADAD